MTVQICLLVWLAGGFLGWLFPVLDVPASRTLLFAGPLSGILLYSAFAVFWRWHGLVSGYTCGGQQACGLGSADWPGIIRGLSAAGYAMSIALAVLSFAMLAACNSCSCGTGELLLKLGLPVCVLALHRIARALGRSMFFVAALVLVVSLLLFSVLGLRPFRLCL